MGRVVGKKNKVVTVTNTYSNTSVNVISITEDRLINILTSHIEKIKKSKEWLAASGFSVSLLLVLLTSDFKNTWGIKADFWLAFIFFIFLGSVIYLVNILYNCQKYKIDVEDIVNDIKQNNPEKETDKNE